MDIQKVQNVMRRIKPQLEACDTRESQINITISALKDAFPYVSYLQAIYGSIENITAKAEHIEIETIIRELEYIKKCQEGVVLKALPGSDDLSSTLSLILDTLGIHYTFI